MIELLYAVERARELLYDPEILSHEIRVPVKRKGGEGIGVLEAPRGPLIHHYWANEDGKIQKAIGQMPLEIIILNHDKSIKNRYLYGNTN